MVLGKLPMPGRPTTSKDSRARAYCACSRCVCVWGGVVYTFFLSSIFSLTFPALWETARHRLKYCRKGPLNTKQPTNNQISLMFSWIND